MPHYQDGRVAFIGDKVRGYCHGNGKETEGILVAIHPGASTCNGQLAYAGFLPGAKVPVVTVQQGTVTLGEMTLVERTPLAGPHAEDEGELAGEGKTTRQTTAEAAPTPTPARAGAD